MWIDFSQPFSGDMPHASSVPSPKFETLMCVEKDNINIQSYTVPTHIGTHVDAPRHFIEDGKTIDELPLDRFAGEAVILDVKKDEPVAVTVDDIEGAHGTVQKDDIVLLYTGWHEKYETPEYNPHPWISTDLADWFVNRGVKLVGVDTTTPDIPSQQRPDEWTEFPVHRTLLDADVLIAEHLTNLAPHTGERLEVQAFPIKIAGGDGAPVRFIAQK